MKVHRPQAPPGSQRYVRHGERVRVGTLGTLGTLGTRRDGAPRSRREPADVRGGCGPSASAGVVPVPLSSLVVRVHGVATDVAVDARLPVRAHGRGVPPRVQLMPRRHRQDVPLGMKRQARDGLAEIESKHALGRPRVPQPHLVVQRAGRQHVGVRRVEPDDPGRSPVSRERRQASAGGAVDQLDGVVAVRRREGPAVGGERGGDGGPGRRSKLAVGGGAVAERVGLRPRREGAIERRRRVRVVLWGDARAERRVRASPRGAGVAAARGSAQSAGGIELARADLGKHRSPRPPRSVRSAPRAFPSRPRLKKEPRGESFPPLRRGASPCEAPVPRALPRASGPRRGATVVTGCAIRVSTTPPRARVCPARRRSTRPFDARFVHLAGFYRLDFFQQGQPLPTAPSVNGDREFGLRRRTNFIFHAREELSVPLTCVLSREARLPARSPPPPPSA